MLLAIPRAVIFLEVIPKECFFLLRPRISLKFVSILCLSESFHNQRKRLSGPVGVIPLPP